MLKWSFIAIFAVAMVLCAVVFFMLIKYAKKAGKKTVKADAVAEEVTADVAATDEKDVKKN